MQLVMLKLEMEARSQALSSASSRSMTTGFASRSGQAVSLSQNDETPFANWMTVQAKLTPPILGNTHTQALWTHKLRLVHALTRGALNVHHASGECDQKSCGTGP